jgi:hypothetical protein
MFQLGISGNEINEKILILSLDGSELLASCSGHFSPEKESTVSVKWHNYHS